MNLKNIVLVCFCTLVLSACIRPYQADVQQGNILNNSDLSEIRYGMSKQEVLFILGTPAIIDPFNESRWDYYFSHLDQNKRETSERLITALFDGDKLVKLSGDVDLSNVQSLEPSTEDQQHGGTVITEPTQHEQGLFNRIKLFNKNRNKRNREKKTEKDNEE